MKVFPKQSPTVLTFPTAGEEMEWCLTEAHIASWQVLFPRLNVEEECQAALAWILAQPERQKTARGMARFLTAWLLRSRRNLPANPRAPSNRWLPMAGKGYVLPCPHTPCCDNTRDCCRRQDADREAR